MARSTHAKSKRTKPPEERFDDLLNAATVVFLKRGASAATVDEITEKAGVSKGTFYLYFKTKDDVVGALWQRYIEEFLSMGEAVLNERELGFLPRITKVFEELTVYVIRNASLHRLVYRTAASLEFSRLNNQKLIAMIGEIVKRGVEAGELFATDPELMVRILFHGVCGAIHDAISSGEDIDENLLVKTAALLTRSTFLPVAPAPSPINTAAAKKQRTGSFASRARQRN